MLRRRYSAIVGQRADFPEQRHPFVATREIADGGIARQVLQRLRVDRGQRPRQALDGSRRLDRFSQRIEARKIEPDGAPLQHLHRIEVVPLDLLDQFLVQRVDLAGDAEGAVAQMAAGAAGDLAKFGGRQVAILIAVEFPVLREGDVVEVEIEAHADGVGGDEVVDVAGLVERHLRVAGARGERAEHDGGAAALAADQLGDRVDLVGREGDDRRAAWQARQLLLAGIGKVRQARPRHDGNALQQPLDDAAHGRGAEKQRLLPAAQMQDPVGEDVAALEISGELHLVDRDEGRVGLARHRLHRADRVSRTRRLDLLLAGDQRHLVRPDLLADAGIDFARQQPQRQADDAAFMRHHAFDGEMRLAGVGGSKYRCDIAPRQDQRLGLLRMNGHRFGTWPSWLCVSLAKADRTRRGISGLAGCSDT